MAGIRRTGWTRTVRSAAAALTASALLTACVTAQNTGGESATPSGRSEANAQRAQTPVRPTGPLNVALLVPLSGPQADTGQTLVTAARTAVTDAGPQGIHLTVHDTHGTPEGARAAADAALAGKADLVLGPLFSVAAQAVKPVLARAGVPALSFSNNRAVAGEGLYLLGHLPGQQTAALLDYAAAQGHGRVVVASPDTSYARMVAQATREHLARGTRGQLVDSRLFPADLDYDSQVDLVKELASMDPTAVVIPTAGIGLVGLSALFEYYDATPPKVRLLGTDLWEWPGAFAEGSLQGGWYVSTSTPPAWTEQQTGARVSGSGPMGTADAMDADGHDSAETDDGAATGSDTGGNGEDAAPAATAPEPEPESEPEAIRLFAGPGKLERLAMDAVALAQGWAKARYQVGAGSDPITRFLTDPAGFRGYTGLFRLTASGLNERGLHVLEITEDGPDMLRPAPVSFGMRGAPTRLVGPDVVARLPWLAAEYEALEPLDPMTGPTASSTAPATAPPSASPGPVAAPAPVSGTDTGCRWRGRVQVCGPTS
ncbi:penicillin-binding protein activator [Roseospira marina]|nr:penicillin-binding protein activator [Roseospira marina]MBB5087549.1 ABC-type branched-subunit amino acid transport system substrate-binding protein [Roseospira marina]